MSLCKYLTRSDLWEYLEEGLIPHTTPNDLLLDPEGFVCLVYDGHKVWYPIIQFLDDYGDEEMIKESAKVINYLEGWIEEPDYRVYVEIDEDFY